VIKISVSHSDASMLQSPSRGLSYATEGRVVS